MSNSATPFLKVESLTYESVRVRAVLVPLKRKVVSRVGFFDRWPLILIDLQTKDFNQGLTLGDAIRRRHALDDRGLYWFEEPTTYNNLEGYALLARELRTPLQLGENFYGPRELYRAVTMQAGDYVMPDMMRIGGVSGWLRSVPIAAAAGIEVSTHLYPEVSAHLMRVTETAHWLEWQDWADPILKEPFPVVAGQLKIPHRAGVGIEWDEDAVKRFAV